MNALRFLLIPVLAGSMLACDSGSTKGTPDTLADASPQDQAAGETLVDPGPDAIREDADVPADSEEAGTDLAWDGPDESPPDPGPDAPDVVPSDTFDVPPADDSDADVPPVVQGTCALPIQVWDGRTIGPDLPTGGLDFEARTGPVTSVTAPSCGPAGTQGEVVFHLAIGKSALTIVNVELQGTDFSAVVSAVKGSCAGPEMACTLPDADTGVLEQATALGPGDWFVIVRLVPKVEGTNPIGQAVDVSFDFEANEDCTNGVDDNADWDVDCDDPLCFADPACTGGHSGEDCTDPFVINDGLPVAGGFEFFASGTLGGRLDDYQAGDGCWSGSAGSGDAVWKFVLDTDMTLEVAVNFYDAIDGQPYILDSTCTAVQACLPSSVSGDPNLLVTLHAGTWYIVVDRGPVPPTDYSFDLYVFFDEP